MFEEQQGGEGSRVGQAGRWGPAHERGPSDQGKDFGLCTVAAMINFFLLGPSGCGGKTLNFKSHVRGLKSWFRSL